LIPKSHKLFIKPVAEELGISEILVDDVVGFYYSELRKNLHDMESVSIKVERLGTFKVKPKEIKSMQLKLAGHLKALDTPETFNQMRLKKDVEDRLANINRISDLLKSEYERKNQIKQKRNEQDKRDMDK